ncbi:MAG: DUF5719 family protein [Vicinamibacterales bacterium]
MDPRRQTAGPSGVPDVTRGRAAGVVAIAACLVLTTPWNAFTQVVTKRLLYVTHSAGFAHDVLPESEAALTQLGATTGAFQTTVMRDVRGLSAAVLANYDAVAFFTSGNLPLDAVQRQALLAFVRSGKAFIGLHSATDTGYDWPEYGDMIGGYFDGHPWTQSVGVVVEDAAHPATAHLAPAWTIADEIYQFRAWSRAAVHVLMRLDVSTVNLAAPGVHRTDGDFALAWTKTYGAGRVFYTALGHGPNVWQDARFAQHLLGGIRWALDDGDKDGLPDTWERQVGLDPQSAAGTDGALGDPDGDGRTNAQELADGTHPRGFFARYLAEGATSAFFATRLSMANAGATNAHVLLAFQKADRSRVTQAVEVPARSSRKVMVGGVPGMDQAEFATKIESDVFVAVDRMMWWAADNAYGTHGESSVAAPASTWYFAEGATHSGFSLFYLLQNPGDATASVRVRYLLPDGSVVVGTYAVEGGSRFNIWVNQIPSLSAAEVSAEITVTGGPPIIAERAMYLSRDGRLFSAGHESAGVVAPARDWLFAEGGTGPFFDTFVLVANPGAREAVVEATYLLPSGPPLRKSYRVAPNSRYNIWLDHESFGGVEALADTAMSIVLHVTNDAPVVAERAMWWPGNGSAWYEAHDSAGAVAASSRWLVAEGVVAGANGEVETFLQIANPSATDAVAHVTLLYDDGTAAESRDVALRASSRTSVSLRSDFPNCVNRGFGILVESGAPAVVEESIYNDAAGQKWAGGANLLGTPF